MVTKKLTGAQIKEMLESGLIIQKTRHIIFVTFAISGLKIHKANLRLQIKQALSYRQPVIRFQIGKLMITVTGMNVNVDTKRMLHNTVLNGW